MSSTHLAQLFLQVTDLETSRAFYEDGFGLEPSDIGTDSVTYETGACELKLEADFAPEELAAFNLETPPESGRGTGAVIVLVVDAPLDTTHERVSTYVTEAETRTETETPGTVLTEPQSVPWGGRLFLVEGPDGYVFEVRSTDEE